MATYLVTVKPPEGDLVGEHLVEAKNQSQARNHIAETHIAVSIATSKDVQRLVREGCEIIDVNAPAEVASGPGAQ